MNPVESRRNIAVHSSNSSSRPNHNNLSGNTINNENKQPIRSISPTPSSSGGYPISPASLVTPQQLDEQFVATMLEVEKKYVNLSRHERIRTEQWTKKLCQITANTQWKRNRNLFSKELLAMVAAGKLREPFTHIPPEVNLPKFNKYDFEPARRLTPTNCPNPDESGSYILPNPKTNHSYDNHFPLQNSAALSKQHFLNYPDSALRTRSENNPSFIENAQINLQQLDDDEEEEEKEKEDKEDRNNSHASSYQNNSQSTDQRVQNQNILSHNSKNRSSSLQKGEILSNNLTNDFIGQSQSRNSSQLQNRSPSPVLTALANKEKHSSIGIKHNPNNRYYHNNPSNLQQVQLQQNTKSTQNQQDIKSSQQQLQQQLPPRGYLPPHASTATTIEESQLGPAGQAQEQQKGIEELIQSRLLSQEKSHMEQMQSIQKTLISAQQLHQNHLQSCEGTIQELNRCVQEKSAENAGLNSQIVKLQNILANVQIQLNHIRDVLPPQHASKLDHVQQSLRILPFLGSEHDNHVNEQQFSQIVDNGGVGSSSICQWQDINENYPRSYIGGGDADDHINHERQQALKLLNQSKQVAGMMNNLICHSQNSLLTQPRSQCTQGKTSKDGVIGTKNMEGDGDYSRVIANYDSSSLKKQEKQQKEQSSSREQNFQTYSAQEIKKPMLLQQQLQPSNMLDQLPQITRQSQQKLESLQMMNPQGQSQQQQQRESQSQFPRQYLLPNKSSQTQYEQRQQQSHSQSPLTLPSKQQQSQQQYLRASPSPAAFELPHPSVSGIPKIIEQKTTRSIVDTAPLTLKSQQDTQDFLSYLDNFQKRTVREVDCY